MTLFVTGGLKPSIISILMALWARNGEVAMYERVNLPARRAHMQSHGARRAPSHVAGIRCNRLHPDRRM